MENNKDGILLETGTNEIEIMEFTIDGNLYGINVAKVREIMLSAPVHPMPHAHPAVEGIFKPRDIVITVVDLPEYLSGHTEPKGEKDLFIITNFNKMHIAFRVHTVVGISRISWRDIQKPDNTVSGGADGVATGIAQCGKDLVTILDFEKIVAEIAPERRTKSPYPPALLCRCGRCGEPVWVAEDSILLSQMIHTALTKAGYTNLRMFQNGAELWEALQACKDGGGPTGQVSIVITDLEMPQMDGHNLTKRIKEDKELQAIPVIIFSSLITEEMRRKGKEVGADEQLSKPEIGHLIGIVDHLLERSRRKREAGQA